MEGTIAGKALHSAPTAAVLGGGPPMAVCACRREAGAGGRLAHGQPYPWSGKDERDAIPAGPRDALRAQRHLKRETGCCFLRSNRHAAQAAVPMQRHCRSKRRTAACCCGGSAPCAPQTARPRNRTTRAAPCCIWVPRTRRCPGASRLVRQPGALPTRCHVQSAWEKCWAGAQPGGRGSRC